MSEARQDIDWSLTTWEGSRRAQLRRALELTLRERFEEMHVKGEFTSTLCVLERTRPAR